MTETDAATDAAYLEILRRTGAAQKLRTMHSLRRTAWTLKAAWVRRTEPQLSEREVQERVRQIFLSATT